jgi:hypothetical protein
MTLFQPLSHGTITDKDFPIVAAFETIKGLHQRPGLSLELTSKMGTTACNLKNKSVSDFIWSVHICLTSLAMDGVRVGTSS